MPASRTTLAEFLSEQRRPEGADDVDHLILEIARSCTGIARQLVDGTGNPDAFGGRALRIRGPYLTVFTPLTGVEPTHPGGSIFSVLPAVASGEPGDHLPGSEQLCAGYTTYGATTRLVLTLGSGVAGFTLDAGSGEFVLTEPELRIPAATSEFAVDTATRRFWNPAVRRYVDECLAGSAGPRARNFTLRWTTSVVAATDRILNGGGVFLGHPRPDLLFTANPLALLVEQAGGRARTGERRVLDVVPDCSDRYTGLVLGAREEVRRIEAYHEDTPNRFGDERDIPFFSGRGLFRVRG